MENKNKSPERGNYTENKFEFRLLINNKIIIARYFSADDYNPAIRNSVDIRYMVDDIVEHIKENLKSRDIDYQWQQYDLRPKHWFDDIENGIDTN
mgnify:CR=1 FL=1